MMLSRGLGSPLLAEIAKPVFYPVTLVYLDWPSGVVRFHSGRGSIVWDSQTWAGVGDFATIEAPDEAFGVVPGEAIINIVGDVADLIDLSLSTVKNRRAAIYVGAVTEPAGSVLVGAPYRQFEGYMDGATFEYQGDADRAVPGLRLQLGSGPGARLGASITHGYDDQRGAFPSDTAGRHVQHAIASARRITWPE